MTLSERLIGVSKGWFACEFDTYGWELEVYV